MKDIGEKILQYQLGDEKVLKVEVLQLRTLCMEGADYLCLAGGQIAQLFGISEATLSRHRKTFGFIKPERRKIWEIAIVFARIYQNTRRLYRVPRKGKFWYFTYSHELRNAPIEMLFRVETLLLLDNHLEKRVAENKVSKYETFNYS